MVSPVIGITLSNTPKSISKEVYFNESPYVKAVFNAGGIPRWIENDTPIESLMGIFGEFDGILLSGGGDIHPGLYGEQKNLKIAGINTQRDTVELELVKLCIESDLPLFGICRGCQMLNVALGGTLYAHIPDEYRTNLNHRLSEEKFPAFLAHEVDITQNSLLRTIIHSEMIWVNSRHHQAIKNLASSLTVTSRATDDLIEGVERTNSRFCLAVQWHPENLQDSQEQKRLFASFISTAGK